jgi:hypothetical protein
VQNAYPLCFFVSRQTLKEAESDKERVCERERDRQTEK